VLAERTGLGSEALRDERAPSARKTADGWRMLYVEPLDGGGSRLRGASCR
jgi:hypothetical protein